MDAEVADMGSGLEDEAALSDFEDDDLEAAPVVLPTSTNTTSAESLKSTLAELEKERQARKAAEAAKTEADSSIARLTSYVREVIRQRDEAVKGKEDLSRQLEEALKSNEDIIRQRDDIARHKEDIQKQKEEISRARDASKSEISEVARILVTQAEKIMSMTSGVRNFSGGLPRFPKSTGLAAIALGFGKRMEEVVDEVLKQREEAVKRRDEINMQMEQRNFSIAIEVSQLEAAITQLKDEVANKSSEAEKLQKLVTVRDGRIAEIEKAMQEQLGKTKHDAEIWRSRVEEVEGKLELVDTYILENTNSSAKARESLLEVLDLMDFQPSSNPLQFNSMAFDNVEDRLHQKFLAGGRELIDLADRVKLAWQHSRMSFDKDKKDLENNVKILIEEQTELKSKSSKLGNQNTVPEDRENTGLVQFSHVPVLSKSIEPGVPDEGNSSPELETADAMTNLNPDTSDFHSDESTGEQTETREAPQQRSVRILRPGVAELEKKNNEMLSKISALEEEVRYLQQELQKTSDNARVSIDRLQLMLATQAKDIARKTAFIVELEKDGKQHIETLTRELLAAEEDVARWKEAATAEAAAGAALLEEVEKRTEEITTLNERLGELKVLVDEANSKVSSKEQMAMAAIAARNAAERSLQIADERASDLRHRIEDMSRQLEELEQRGDYRVQGLLNMCWPWLRGRGRPGFSGLGLHDHGSAEMEELLEPLV